MLVKTNKHFNFCSNSTRFVRHNEMISATKLAQSRRQFILSLCNKPIYPPEVQELFKKGIANHDYFQRGIEELDDVGYNEYRKRLRKHEQITLKELKIISPMKAVYGVIDVITVEYTKEKDVNVFITELKSGYNSKYIIQLIAYALMCSDLNAKIVYEVPLKRKEGVKREIGSLFPSQDQIRYLNIYGKIHIFGQRSRFKEMVIRNDFIGWAGEVKMFVDKRIRDYQEIMRQKVIDITHIPHSADGSCCKSGWGYLCKKYEYNPKEFQRFYGKKKLLVKTKSRGL